MALTAVDALRELQAELAGANAEEVPEGYKTTAQWAAETNTPERTVRETMARGLKSGMVEKRKFRVMAECRTCSLWHFRIKPKGKK